MDARGLSRAASAQRGRRERVAFDRAAFARLYDPRCAYRHGARAAARRSRAGGCRDPIRRGDRRGRDSPPLSTRWHRDLRVGGEILPERVVSVGRGHAVGRGLFGDGADGVRPARSGAAEGCETAGGARRRAHARAGGVEARGFTLFLGSRGRTDYARRDRGATADADARGDWARGIRGRASRRRDGCVRGGAHGETAGRTTGDLARVALRQSHQIVARTASPRTIGSPALHPNACANSGRFEIAPITRHSPGECGSVRDCRIIASGRILVRHAFAKAMKKRCSGVNPSTGARDLPVIAFSNAAYAIFSPPKSAMFSPSVSLPFTWNVSETMYAEY